MIDALIVIWAGGALLTAIGCLAEVRNFRVLRLAVYVFLWPLVFAAAIGLAAQDAIGQMRD